MERVSDDELLERKRRFAMEVAIERKRNSRLALEELQERRKVEKANEEKPLAARPISGKEAEQLMESSENALRYFFETSQ